MSRKVSTTMRVWDSDARTVYVTVPAWRCLVCRGKWPKGESAQHRDDCLEVEMREATR